MPIVVLVVVVVVAVVRWCFVVELLEFVVVNYSNYCVGLRCFASGAFCLGFPFPL